jgi:hypothetical protein
MGVMDKALRQFALEMGVARQEIVNGLMDQISGSELCNVVSSIELVVDYRPLAVSRVFHRPGPWQEQSGAILVDQCFPE